MLSASLIMAKNEPPGHNKVLKPIPLVYHLSSTFVKIMVPKIVANVRYGFLIPRYFDSSVKTERAPEDRFFLNNP